jgi:hypothetical protein
MTERETGKVEHPVAETLPAKRRPPLLTKHRQIGGLQLSTIEEFQRFASAAVACGIIPAKNGEKAAIGSAVMCMQYGAELGLPPMSSLTEIYIINGKPTMSAGLLATLVKGSGTYDYKVDAHDNAVCKLVFLEAVDGEWEPVGTSDYSIEDAEKAGLLNGRTKENWEKHTRNMLFARAVSNGVRWHCPHLSTCTIYTHDEVEAAQ